MPEVIWRPCKCVGARRLHGDPVKYVEGYIDTMNCMTEATSAVTWKPHKVCPIVQEYHVGLDLCIGVYKETIHIISEVTVGRRILIPFVRFK